MKALSDLEEMIMQLKQKNAQLLEQIADLKQRLMQLEGEEKQFFEVLIALSENIHRVTNELVNELGEVGHKEILENCEGVVVGLMESVQEVSEMPYRVIKLKKIFEMLDDLVSEMDDLIEDANEVVSNGLSYIEDWDVAFFFDHM